MGFASHYFKRYGVSSTFLTTPGNYSPDIIVVVPVCNEPELDQCIESLKLCNGYKSRILLLLVVNHSVLANPEVKLTNSVTWHNINESVVGSDQGNFKIQGIFLQDLPKKTAGVGFARKTGMDEAIRIFNLCNNDSGLIVSLDADCRVSMNYFSAIEQYYHYNTLAEAAVIRFAHPVSGNVFTQEIYHSACLYEIYLRYFKNALS